MKNQNKKSQVNEIMNSMDILIHGAKSYVDLSVSIFDEINQTVRRIEEKVNEFEDENKRKIKER